MRKMARRVLAVAEDHRDTILRLYVLEHLADVPNGTWVRSGHRALQPAKAHFESLDITLEEQWFERGSQGVYTAGYRAAQGVLRSSTVDPDDGFQYLLYGKKNNSAVQYAVAHKEQILRGEQGISHFKSSWAIYMKRWAISEKGRKSQQGISLDHEEFDLRQEDIRFLERNNNLSPFELAFQFASDPTHPVGKKLRDIIQEAIDGERFVHSQKLMAEMWFRMFYEIGPQMSSQKNAVRQKIQKHLQSLGFEITEAAVRVFLTRKWPTFMKRLKQRADFQSFLGDMEEIVSLSQTVGGGRFAFQDSAMAREATVAMEDQKLFWKCGAVTDNPSEVLVTRNDVRVGSVVAAKAGEEGWICVLNDGSPLFKFGNVKLYRS